jgi:pyridoxamine 5'-phosphate oxidase-like protein
MSIRMAPDLQAVARERSHAYVVTVAEDGSPHTVYAPIRWERDGLVAEVGARTAANAAIRPAVSLLYPVRADGDYSLIVDGTAVVEPGDDGRRLRVAPARAVFHRPGIPSDPASACGADCVPIALSLGRS